MAATAGSDYQGPVGWPTLNSVVISPGVTGSAFPLSDADFTYNPSTHTLTSSGANSLGNTTVGGFLDLTALSGSGPLPTFIDNTGTVQPGNYGVVELNFALIDTLSPGTQGLITSSSQPVGVALEYPIGYLATHATLTCNVLQNGETGSSSAIFGMTRNGTIVSGAFFTINAGSGTGLSSGTLATGSGAATDTYALLFSQSGGAGTMELACHLGFN